MTSHSVLGSGVKISEQPSSHIRRRHRPRTGPTDSEVHFALCNTSGVSAARPATGTSGREARPERDLSITWMGAGLPPSARLLLAGVTQCFGRELQLVDAGDLDPKSQQKAAELYFEPTAASRICFRHPCSVKNRHHA